MIYLFVILKVKSMFRDVIEGFIYGLFYEYIYYIEIS